MQSFQDELERLALQVVQTTGADHQDVVALLMTDYRDALAEGQTRAQAQSTVRESAQTMCDPDAWTPF